MSRRACFDNDPTLQLSRADGAASRHGGRGGA